MPSATTLDPILARWMDAEETEALRRRIASAAWHLNWDELFRAVGALMQSAAGAQERQVPTLDPSEICLADVLGPRTAALLHDHLAHHPLYVSQLQGVNDEQLRAVPNIGDKTVGSIREVTDKYRIPHSALRIPISQTGRGGGRNGQWQQ